MKYIKLGLSLFIGSKESEKIRWMHFPEQVVPNVHTMKYFPTEIKSKSYTANLQQNNWWNDLPLGRRHKYVLHPFVKGRTWPLTQPNDRFFFQVTWRKIGVSGGRREWDLYLAQREMISENRIPFSSFYTLKPSIKMTKHETN